MHWRPLVLFYSSPLILSIPPFLLIVCLLFWIIVWYLYSCVIFLTFIGIIPFLDSISLLSCTILYYLVSSPLVVLLDLPLLWLNLPTITQTLQSQSISIIITSPQYCKLRLFSGGINKIRQPHRSLETSHRRYKCRSKESRRIKGLIRLNDSLDQPIDRPRQHPVTIAIIGTR